MRSQLQRLSSWRWLLPTVVVFAELNLTGLARAQDLQKQVLVLYTTRRDAQIALEGERELPRILENGLSEGLDYYSEFLDPARFSDPDYPLALRDFLRLKYKGHRFDIVIAMGDDAVRFLDEQRNEWSDTPLIFYANSRAIRRPANSTGITAELNLSGTLGLATALQPETRHLFVISGADNADTYENTARAQFRSFEPRLDITYLSGLTTKDLEARVKALPEKSIIYYLLVDRDGAGEYFHPLHYLDRIAAVANAPIYCWVDSAMGRGIVGGSLKSLSAQVEAMGKLTLRVLHGERPDSIPTSSPDLNVTQVDWRQLQRWNINEARVPAGTLVRFREPSAWGRYKVYIISALALLLAQSALIAGLLVQRTRRRQAEEQVRGSQAALRASYDRIRDLGSRLLNAQETERSRVARELHDDISQQVALLAIDLELLNSAVHDNTKTLADEALTHAQDLAKSVHDLSHRLHPAKLRLIGLVAALRGLQHELSQSGIVITFTHDDVPSTLPPEVTLCVFRIVQEALQNALRHSRADEVSVHLGGSPDGLALTIVDNGVGFEVSAPWGNGLGLISMGERLEAIGGTFEIRSTPGAGTRIEVTVPLRAVWDKETIAV